MVFAHIKDVGFQSLRREAMIFAVRAAVHFSGQVPLISPANRHRLAEEVRKNGHVLTAKSLTDLAKTLRKKGDEENAQQSEKEAQYVMDVFSA